MSKTLFVGNVPWGATNEGLLAYFSSVGAVTSVNIIVDRMTGRSKGIAFVEIPNDDDLPEFISALHDREFEGRKLLVSEARPREDRSPRRY